MVICSPDKCSGCFACQSVCPKNCISKAVGRIGHLYPQVDETLCINCGACARVCPQNEKPKTNIPSAAYAAFSANCAEHKASTSGGLANVLSRKILKHGGVVYGCSSEIEKGIRHIRITDEEELYRLRGSKYVQSDISECYSLVAGDLENEKTVLFIGTPCQIGGLKNFLKTDRKNLITADLLCHGVPSQRVLFEHLEASGVKGGDAISFRDGGYYLCVKNGDSNLYRKRSAEDLYYRSFLGNLTLRDSCHNCSFASKERCSDITIGDFWGLGNDCSLPREDGVSLVLLNTEKGEKIFSLIRDELCAAERALSEAIAGNHSLRAPAPAAKNREKFILSYEKCGFQAAASRALSKVRLRRKIIGVLKKILHR